MRPIITSRKHYVQFTEFNVASATVTANLLVDAVALQSANTPSEVVEGDTVKAVFIELWLLSDDASVGSFVVTVERFSIDQGAPTFAEMTTLDTYKNKKNILYTSQGILGINNSNPTPVLRQWFKIPKGKQRFGLDDGLRVNIAAIGASQIVGCSFATYKSYS